MKEAVISKEISDIKERLRGENTFVVTDEIIYSLYGELFAGAKCFVMDSGEQFKTLATVESILAAMTAGGCNRKTTVIAVGGGVVGDTAGFAASIFMRGVNWINVPTTLLAQVDSGIGGKTGVDIDCYKNIAGSFWMPEEVHIRTDFLKTLPSREWMCGMGEVIKHASIDNGIYGFVLENTDALFGAKEEIMERLVTLNVRYKESVVAQDFKEQGIRKRLNAGHTVGHAVEKLDGFKMSHGRYVALGLRIEMTMFRELIEPDFYENISAMTKRICAEKPMVSAESIAAAARADKKNPSGKISFMIPTGGGQTAEQLIDAKEMIRRLKCLSVL